MDEHSHNPQAASHGDLAHHGAGQGGHDHGHGGLAKYIYVFIALCVLTSGSFMTYFPFWREHFPPAVGWSFMLAIAITKAMLVILFFMHVKYEANWKYVLTIPAAMMSLFLILMLVPDIGMRSRMASDEVHRLEAQPAETDHAEPAIEHGDGGPAAHVH